MEEASQLDDAVAIALNETGHETLILVTADHSHSFTINGYGDRGNDILGARKFLYKRAQFKRRALFYRIYLRRGQLEKNVSSFKLRQWAWF